MLIEDLLSRSVPRVELDLRVREARLREERVERALLPLPKSRERGGRVRRGLRLLAAAVNGGGAGGQIGTPQRDRPDGRMTAPDLPLRCRPACA